jgi:hypothetical protein
MRDHGRPRRSATTTEREYLGALDVMEHACRYLGQTFSFSMPRLEARAYFDAWSLLLRKRLIVYNEYVGIFHPDEEPITQAEVDAAISAARGARQ